MTKQMIDVDALLEKIKLALDFNDPTNVEMNIGWKGACLMITEEINELATPANEPQSKKGD